MVRRYLLDTNVVSYFLDSKYPPAKPEALRFEPLKAAS
jgi:predicted nucleic acid-binding protein